MFKITDFKDSCSYAAAGPATLVLALPAISPNPVQGSSPSFSASFHYVSVPSGTPIFFQVTGANSQIKMSHTDVSGLASFS